MTNFQTVRLRYFIPIDKNKRSDLCRKKLMWQTKLKSPRIKPNLFNNSFLKFRKLKQPNIS